LRRLKNALLLRSGGGNMIGVDVLTGVVEILATGAILFVIWKFMGKIEPDIEQRNTKH
jgi:hypothetical protein